MSDTAAVPWAPGSISDLLTFAGGYVAIDRMAATVSWLSSDLDSTYAWGGKGAGPEEFRQPVAGATDPSGDTLWVLDRAGMRLTAYDARFTAVRSIRLQRPFDDVAVAGSGRIYLGTHVLANMLRLGRPSSVEAVVAYSLDRREIGAVRSITVDSLTFPRFNLQGVNFVRVAAAGGRTIIYYPSSGVLEFLSARGVTSSRVCVPPDVDEAYQRQLEATKQDLGGPVVDRWFPVISDVLLRSSDTVLVFSPAPTRAGAYHVDRFTTSGEPLGSSLIMPNGHELGSKVYFGSADGRTIIDVDVYGRIAKYRLERWPGQGADLEREGDSR